VSERETDWKVLRHCITSALCSVGWEKVGNDQRKCLEKYPEVVCQCSKMF
jgi:hypothetical protein